MSEDEGTAERAQEAVALVALGAVGLSVLSPALGTGYGSVDDHEVLRILSGRDRLPLSEVLSEVATRTAEPIARFRPGYWVFRMTETATAGDNWLWWHANRVALAIISMLLLFALLRRWASVPVSAVAAASILIWPAAETWTRLGPAESYAVPLALGGALLLSRGRHVRAGLVLLLCAGLTKESFLALMLPAIAVSYRVWPRRRRDLSVIAVATFIAGMVLLWKRAEYGDIYGRPLTIGGVARTFVDLGQATGVLLLLGAIVAVAARPEYGRWWYALALVLMGSQAVFYADGLSTGRYLWPTLLLAPVLFAVAIGAAMKNHTRLGATATVAFGTLILLAASETHAAAEETAARSREYEEVLTMLRATNRPVRYLTRGMNEVELELSARTYVGTPSTSGDCVLVVFSRVPHPQPCPDVQLVPRGFLPTSALDGPLAIRTPPG